MYSMVQYIYIYVHIKYSNYIVYTYQLSSLQKNSAICFPVKIKPRPWLLGPNKACFRWWIQLIEAMLPWIFSMGGDRGKKRNWRDFHVSFFSETQTLVLSKLLLFFCFSNLRLLDKQLQKKKLLTLPRRPKKSPNLNYNREFQLFPRKVFTTFMVRSPRS